MMHHTKPLGEQETDSYHSVCGQVAGCFEDGNTLPLSENGIH